MTFPLQLSKDYIKLDDTKARTTPKEIPVEYGVAERFGLCRTYFTSSTKKIRVIRLLGGGNVETGYTKYLKVVEDLNREFHKMCEILDDRILGYTVFDSFAGHSHKKTSSLKHEVEKRGIPSYKKLMTVHKILKNFKKLEAIRKSSLHYIPIDQRIPLTEKFIKKYYWNKKMTTGQIAAELVVPEIHVQKEIKRLGMKKKDNGIKLRGKKGFVMPEEQKIKHQNQPHARAVVQICPRTFKILRRYNSTGAVERDGWSRENVRKAIKSAGLHDGFLWSYDGTEAEIIERAKGKGNLKKKLKIWENGPIQKETLQKLYIDQDLNKDEIAEILGCTPGAVACCASRFGLTKRINIDDATLKRLYLDERRSAKEIAEMTGYAPSSISTYLSNRGIKRSKTK